MRHAEIIRATGETDINLRLLLDGSGRSVINSGVGFLDHMLTLFAKHGRFDLEVNRSTFITRLRTSALRSGRRLPRRSVTSAA